MHAHVVGDGDPNHEQINKDIFFLYIANGITSIRAMLGAPNQLVLREQLRRGEVLGPTMNVSAPSLNGNSAPNPDAAIKLVLARRKRRLRFLKIHPGLSRETLGLSCGDRQGPGRARCAVRAVNTVLGRGAGLRTAKHTPC
jgi:hypothetical protein